MALPRVQGRSPVSVTYRGVLAAVVVAAGLTAGVPTVAKAQSPIDDGSAPLDGTEPPPPAAGKPPPAPATPAPAPPTDSPPPPATPLPESPPPSRPPTSAPPPVAPTQPTPPAAPQPVAPIAAEQREYEEWQAERRLILAEREEEREDRLLKERAQAVANQLRHTWRAVIDAALGFSLAPIPVDPTIEGNLRFELGGGVQRHFLDVFGVQFLALYGLNGVTRANVTTREMRNLLTTFHEFGLEANALLGPFGRFHVALGPWASIGGYGDGSVQTLDQGRVGSTPFPNSAGVGDATVAVGPNFKFGAYIGGEHRMAVGAKIQPGAILTNDLDSIVRLSAYFSVFLP